MVFREKIKKEKKLWPLVALGIMIAVGGGLKIYNIFHQPSVFVNIHEQSFVMMIADTPNKAYQGLSGKKDLGKYAGMVFLFNYEDYYTMVMRDMNFPLDIVWLKDGVVVDMAPKVLVEDNKSESELIRYRPRLPADAVLELKAGLITETGLKIGDKVLLTKNQ
jgi:hypothetical protein